MKTPEVTTLASSDSAWRRQVDGRLAPTPPARLWALGNSQLLAGRKVGLFCSAACPNQAQSHAYDSARKLRDEGITVISGFHSAVEKECLRILLQGHQPIIVCLGRALGRIRVPVDWRPALEADRLLLLSQFEKSRRTDREAAYRRNRLVAALSDEVLIIHARPGGSIERISELIAGWGIPPFKIDSA